MGGHAHWQRVPATLRGWRRDGFDCREWQRHLLTDVLKTRMGFDGLLVSDWDGIDEVQGCSKDRCAQAINAGIDLIMVPEQWKAFLANTVAQVRAGDIPMSRIDDAVTRVLRVKLRAGLFEKGRPSARPLANKTAQLGAAGHRAVAREAVRKSIVLLKNDKCLLPLSAGTNVLVAGDGADNIGKQAGGWTISWQGTGNTNADFPGATSIFDGIRSAVTASGGTATLSAEGHYETKPDVAIVVFGENPYAEWHGDIKSIEYQGPSDDGHEIDLQRPAPEVSSVIGSPPVLRQSARAPRRRLAACAPRACRAAVNQRGGDARSDESRRDCAAPATSRRAWRRTTAIE